MLCFHCLLKIPEPTLPKLRQSVNSLHFDKAIKSAISTRQDQNIKEIRNNSHFPYRKRDTFACLPTGYGKTLIFQLAVRVCFETRKSNDYKLKPNYRQYHFRHFSYPNFSGYYPWFVAAVLVNLRIKTRVRSERQDVCFPLNCLKYSCRLLVFVTAKQEMGFQPTVDIIPIAK